jgi:hypothetical protein
MKRIEDEVKPIMTPLILGQPRRLSPKDQEIIAAWAVLKSIVTNYDGEAKIVTHHMQRKFLKRHRRAPEKGWGVWICNFDRQNWRTEWVSRPFRILPDKQAAKHADGRVAFYNGNATTQFIGKLLIHVINTTAPRCIEKWDFPIPPRGIIVRIWPSRRNYSLLWPPSAITTDEADRIPDMFIDWLKSLRRPTAA